MFLNNNNRAWMLLNGYLLQGISSIRLWEGYLHPTNYFVTILESDVNYSSVTESWPSTRHAPDRRKCHNSQSESCTESYWPMTRQEMHSEGSIISSVIVISVSTALWFPTSAPPSPLTSETHKKCVITISYLSQWSVICSHRTPPGLTWPRCRWGWGWFSRSSCRQWVHWFRQTPWPPPSRSTRGVSGWCSCSPGWLLSSPNAKHLQSKKHQFNFRGSKTYYILPISQKLWVQWFLQFPPPCTVQSSPETIWTVRDYFFTIHNFSLMWYNCGCCLLTWLDKWTRWLHPPSQPDQRKTGWSPAWSQSSSKTTTIINNYSQ